jgi:hypothetical protein
MTRIILQWKFRAKKQTCLADGLDSGPSGFRIFFPHRFGLN